jgi:hypothetical protein
MISPDMANNFNALMSRFGVKFVLFKNSVVYNDYDEASGTTVTGSIVGSCYTMPVSESRNGDDYQYLQQGLIKMEDLKVFMPSGVINENDLFVIPTGSYTVLKSFPWNVEGTEVYRKIYIRSSGV